MVRRDVRARGPIAVLMAVCAMAAIPLVAAPAASARPTRAADGQSDPNASGALTAQPANMTWARQILNRYADNDTTADVVALASALDKTTNPSAVIRTVVLKKPQVDARVSELFTQVLDRPVDPEGKAYWSGRVQAGST